MLGWGEQIDVRAIKSGEFDQADDLTDVRVARYIAKYATKAAETVGVQLPPMACRRCVGSGRVTLRTVDKSDVYVPCSTCNGLGQSLDLDQWDLTRHARTLIETCWRLGAIPELAPLRLHKWLTC